MKRINLLVIFLVSSSLFISCSKIENFSFYEYFINPDTSDIDTDNDTISDKPDIESVPEKVVINE